MDNFKPISGSTTTMKVSFGKKSKGKDKKKYGPKQQKPKKYYGRLKEKHTIRKINSYSQWDKLIKISLSHIETKSWKINKKSQKLAFLSIFDKDFKPGIRIKLLIILSGATIAKISHNPTRSINLSKLLYRPPQANK